MLVLRAAIVGLAFYIAVLAVAETQNGALELQQRATDRINDYRQNSFKGDAQKQAAELDRADTELSVTVDLFINSGDNAAAAYSLLQLGEIRKIQQRPAEAFEFFKRAFDLATKAGNASRQTWALIGQGEAKLAGKDFAAATDCLQKARAIADNLPIRTYSFTILRLQAKVQTAGGDLIGAANLLNRALALGPELKDQSQIFSAYFDRAGVYQHLASKAADKSLFANGLQALELAKADCEKARAIAQKYDNALEIQTTEDSLRDFEKSRSNIENQQKVEANANSKMFSPKKPGDVWVTEHYTLQASAVEAGKTQSDLEHAMHYEERKDSFDKMLQKWGTQVTESAQGLFLRANLHSFKGESDAALSDYLKAIELLEAGRINLPDEKARSTFFDDKMVFYYAAIPELLERRRFAEAFQIMERSRSRGMADLLSSKKLTFSGREEQALYGQVESLRAEIDLLQKTLFWYRSEHDKFQSQIKSTEEKIQQLEKQNQNVTAEVGKKAPRLRELVVSQPVSLDRVQQILRRDRCDMLYYLVDNTRVILWHIGGDSVHLRNVLLPRSVLQAKINALQNGVASRYAKFDETTARELFFFLIQPALAWITSQHLVLIPNAELNDLPFAALIDPSGKSLGEAFALSDAPSAGILLDLKKGEAIAKSRLLAAADPGIEEARGEVEAVAAFYAEDSKTVVESLITESEVKSSAAGYDVLHFSVHGKFNPLEPMLSYLEFGKDRRNDGRLTAAEMFGLPLDKVKLVVLSACETGQTEATLGNEILGMERALVFAGANNLVLSSWKVDAASTALWMKTFHREAQQKPLAEAARLALLEVKSKFPEPYHWAAFRLVGR